MKNISIIISGMILLLLSGCTKNFEEINTDPNNPPTSDANYIFNYVVKEGAGEYGVVTSYNHTFVQRWVMQTSVIFGNSTMPPYELFNDIKINDLWDYYYSNLLLNCQILVKQTGEDPEDLNKHQVARIWKAYCFHRVTDMWGDVPYSEAWGALEEYTQESTKPKYDPQEEIYLNLISELKDASEKINPSIGFYADDLLFNGDLDLWIKFANSLRLRLAVRSGDETVVSEIVTEEKLISAIDESALFGYIDSKVWGNPYYRLNVESKDDEEKTGDNVPRISKLMSDQLMGTGDPRLAVFAQPIEDDDISFRGVPNLVNVAVKEDLALKLFPNNTSYIGRYFSEDPKMVKPVLSHAEVCFLRAEAGLRGWTADNPQTWYEAGVRSSMEHYNIEPAEIDSFLLKGGAWADSLGQIMTQKWVTLFLDGWEAFSEYRRTGYPQLKKYELELSGINITDSVWVDVPREYVPGRLPYPDREINVNKESYLKAVEQMGGDDYYQQVWWSKQFGTVEY